MKAEPGAAVRALEQALAVEQAGREFYEKALARTKSRDDRRIYEHLIEDEKEHYRILMAEYNSLRGGGGWIPLNAARKTPAELVLKEEATDVEALRLAMGFEQKGYEMYRKAAEESQDLPAKAVYDYLAKQENGHFVYLQKTHDYLTTQGAWMFDDLEKPHLD